MEWDYLVKLSLALVAGGLIGAEREYRDKAAGFRTIILIAVASCLFTILSTELVMNGTGDQSRIAAGIVTGVGFLGAGVILRDRGRIVGLTTAATIWAAAAIGMGFGTGLHALTLSATGMLLVVLWMLPFLEGWIDRIRHTQSYIITTTSGPGRIAELEGVFLSHGLAVHSRRDAKEADRITITILASGSVDAHAGATAVLMADPQVLALGA